MEEFEAIYSEYYPKVYAYIFRLCQNADLAEEVTQEAFCKALRKIDSFRGECKLSVWIYQIAKNELCSQLKRQKRFIYDGLEDCVNEDSFEKMVENKELVTQLHQVISSLEEPYREIFRLRIFEERSFKEIGSIYQKSETWARVTYHRSKMKIRESML